MTNSKPGGDGVASFDFDFARREPARPLSRLVESLWFARGTVPYQRERIAPTGSTVAVFVLGDPIVEIPDDGHGEPMRAETGFIIGPHVRPVINEPLGETHAVGVVTTAVGCEALFGCRPAALRSRVVDLASTWPAAVEVRPAILARRDPDEILALLEARLADDANWALPGLERCEQAVALLEESPTRKISEIADAVGLTHPQLDREFGRIVGLSPRRLARLLRLRRVLGELDIGGDLRWADVAARHGWYDQTHFIRDFKRHTGVTPSAYVDAQRAVYSPVEPGDAAGFVPEV